MSGPAASSPEARNRMQANRRRDTKPEKLLRSILHARGRRYRIDYPIRPAYGVRPIRPDIVFPQAKLAIFVDGCFWHSCPEHGTMPKANQDYWRVKLAENLQRDHRTTTELTKAGWKVIRLWTHISALEAADRVEEALKRAGIQPSSM